MEVDLQRLKAELEKELQELEQRKAVLNDQMAHIESVELMVRVSSKAEEDQPEETDLEGSPEGGAGKPWFRK